jgi:hypothetical protein
METQTISVTATDYVGKVATLYHAQHTSTEVSGLVTAVEFGLDDESKVLTVKELTLQGLGACKIVPKEADYSWASYSYKIDSIR